MSQNTIKKQAKKFPIIEQFCGQEKVLVAGSTWLPDEIVLGIGFLQQHRSYKLIIAPHQIDEAHLLQVEKL